MYIFKETKVLRKAWHNPSITEYSIAIFEETKYRLFYINVPKYLLLCFNVSV